MREVHENFQSRGGRFPTYGYIIHNAVRREDMHKDIRPNQHPSITISTCEHLPVYSQIYANYFHDVWILHPAQGNLSPPQEQVDQQGSVLSIEGPIFRSVWWRGRICRPMVLSLVWNRRIGRMISDEEQLGTGKNNFSRTKETYVDHTDGNGKWPDQ